MGKALTLCSEKKLKSQVPWKEEINKQPHLVLILLSELRRQLFWLAQERSTVLCCFLGQNPRAWVPEAPSKGFPLVRGHLGAAPGAVGPKGAQEPPWCCRWSPAAEGRPRAAPLLFWGKMKWPCQQPPVLIEFRINSASSGVGCY